MSKAGCPYDNAPSFSNDEYLDEAVLKYAFVWYNHVRPHSYNNWMTPFEARYI